MNGIKRKIATLMILSFIMGFEVNDVLRDMDYERFDKAEAYYVVQPGDTFDDIIYRFRKDDARNPYILKFKEEVIRDNPAIEPGKIYPGDVIKIRYYRKAR